MTHLKSKKAQANYIKEKLKTATTEQVKKLYMTTEKTCKKKKR